MLFLTDILPTGYEVGVRNGRVQPGDVVVVAGAGPAGLAAIQTAGLSGAASVIAVDLVGTRLEHVRRFGAPTTLHLEELRIKNITVTTGLVDGTTVSMLLQLVQSGKVAGELFGTHEFQLHDMLSAYQTFGNAAETNALKVVIKR